jgi:signal transduction histidine kinase
MDLVELPTERRVAAQRTNPLASWLISSRPNFEPYGISPVWLSFRQRDLEDRYQTFILQGSLQHIRFASIAALALMLSFGFLDPIVYREKEALHFATLIRFLVLVPSPFVVFLPSFLTRYRTIAQWVGIAALGVVGIGWCVLTYNSNVVTLAYVFPAVVMDMAFGFFLVGLFFRYAFIIGIFVNAIYSAAIWTVDLPDGMAISVDVSMITIFSLFALAAYQKELISRQLFVSESRERDAQAKQRQNDSRYIAWLRQLAVFLRHEVRHPIARINSSIEIAGLASQDNPRIKPHLDNATLDAQHVWNLVERASQATDAEAFVRQGKPERVDLSRLLGECVEAYRQTNSGIEFRLEAPNDVYAEADATLTREAVGNLLGNAASFARHESTVEVFLSREGPNARIAVVNRGPTISGDTEELFGPFSSTRAGPASEHHGLGLYLVRLIAEYHGGSAGIANLSDGSGVEAAMTLPLAATPRRPSDSRGRART